MAGFDEKTTLEKTSSEMNNALADQEQRVAVVLYYRNGAKAMPLVEDKPITVGRAWPADAIVADMSLSRQHARFLRSSDGFFVEDLGSTNGTKVAGERITRAKIAPGDQVQLGAVTAAVHIAQRHDGLLGGIEGHDPFMTRLEEEVLRAKAFGRPLALFMIEAIDAEDGHVSRWCPRVRSELRAVDHLAIYGPASILVAAPETDATSAARLGSSLIRRAPGEPRLRCGFVVCPDDARTAEKLLELARKAAQRGTKTSPIQGMDRLALSEDAAHLVVESEKMREVFDLVERVARSVIPVLILGETGVGKEVIANRIHQRSPRKSKPMRSINCGAIPGTLIESALFGHERGAFTGAEKTTKGLFEQADGGTVFLDEVGELSPAAQAALLRVLETKRLTRVGSAEEIEVDIRVLAATHGDLEAMVQDGRFRMDLLYRLNTMTLRIPSLRERREEIMTLASLFLEEASKHGGVTATTFTEEATELLETYDWPGNVRELRNVIERAAVICRGETIGPDDLSDRVRGGGQEGSVTLAPLGPDDDRDFKLRVRQFESDLIVEALQRAGGNQTEAARLLKMPLRTLVHKIRSYGIKKQYSAE